LVVLLVVELVKPLQVLLVQFINVPGLGLQPPIILDILTCLKVLLLIETFLNLEVAAAGVPDVHRPDQRCSFLEWLVLAFLFVFDVDDLLQEDVQGALGEATLLHLAIFEVAFVLLHRDEILLRMRPALRSRPRLHKVLNFPPILPKKSDPLQEFLVLLLRPATLAALPLGLDG